MTSDDHTAEDVYKAPAADVTVEPEHGYDETHPLSPKGRIGRLQYLGFGAALWFAAMFVVFGLTSIIGFFSKSDVLPAAATFLILGIYIVAFAATFIFAIKRLHDFNASGWFSALTIIPIANMILGLVLVFMPGTKGANRFGPPPKPPSSSLTIVIGIVIVVFIGGIVAAVAIPAYQDYVKAAQEAGQVE